MQQHIYTHRARFFAWTVSSTARARFLLLSLTAVTLLLLFFVIATPEQQISAQEPYYALQIDGAMPATIQAGQTITVSGTVQRNAMPSITGMSFAERAGQYVIDFTFSHPISGLFSMTCGLQPPHGCSGTSPSPFPTSTTATIAINSVAGWQQACAVGYEGARYAFYYGYEEYLKYSYVEVSCGAGTPRESRAVNPDATPSGPTPTPTPLPAEAEVGAIHVEPAMTTPFEYVNVSYQLNYSHSWGQGGSLSGQINLPNLEIGAVLPFSFEITPPDTALGGANLSLTVNASQPGSYNPSHFDSILLATTITEPPATPVPPTPTNTPEPVTCLTVNAVQVCADDFVDVGGGVYNGSQNVRIGDTIAVNGLPGIVSVNPGAGTIDITGTVNYVLNDSTFVPLKTGALTFSAGQTSSGQMLVTVGSAWELPVERTRVEFDADTLPQVVMTLNYNGDLVLTGGLIKLNVPQARTIPYTEFRMSPAGEISGAVPAFAPFTFGSLFEVQAASANFTNDGLKISGQVIIRHLTADTLIPYSGLVLTWDSVSMAVEPGSGVDFSAVGEVEFGPATLQVGSVGFAYGDTRGVGSELYLQAEDVSLALDADLFDGGQSLAVEAESLRIYADDVEFVGLAGSGKISLPPLSLKGFRLSDVEVEVERRAPDGEDPYGGYAFAGGGMLEVRNFIRRSASADVGITVGVKVYLTNDELQWENLQAALKGLNVPLGTTPVYLTSLAGAVDLSGEYAQFEAQAELEVGTPALRDAIGVPLLSGSPSLTINEEGWGSFSGSMALMGQFEAANAVFSVNKPGESIRGARGSFTLNALDILIGTMSLYAGLGDPSFEGTGTVTAQLPVAYLPEFLQPFFETDPIPFGQVQAVVGRLANRYGVGANLTFGEDNRFGLFINSRGTVTAQRGWITVDQGGTRAPHVASSSRSLVQTSQTAPRVPTTSIDLTGTAEAVIFHLNASACPGLKLRLVDPSGQKITHKALPDYAELGRANGVWSYLVHNPSAGLWQMQVYGTDADTAPCSAEAFVRDSLPVIGSLNVTLVPGGYQIAWTASDPEGSAVIDLYLDADTGEYDGVQLVAGIPVAATGYTWDGSAPTGTYTLYAVVRDDENLPVFSPHSAPITVTDTAVPAVPTALSARADEDTVLVSWMANPESDLAGYTVSFRYGGGPLQQITTPYPSTSLTRLSGQDLTVNVRAVDTSGNESADSAPLTVLSTQMDDLTAPDSPVLLSAVPDGAQVQLAWAASAAPDVASYRVYYDYGTNTTFQASGSLSGASPIEAGLAVSTTLGWPAVEREVRFVITALDSAGNESPYSNVLTVQLRGGEQQGQNMSFETSGSTSATPASWTINGADARRKCGSVAFTGDCALQVSGSASGSTTTIVQRLTNIGMTGDSLWFSAMMQGKNITGGMKVRLKLRYADGRSLKLELPVAAGTYAYRLVESRLDLDGSVTSLKIQIKRTATSGKLLLDDIEVRYAPEGAAVPRSLNR